jgi:hypothetical protein
VSESLLRDRFETNPRPEFYSVDTNPPWGDYGDVLVNGKDFESDSDRPARLLRTGPFMPPITFLTYPRRCIVSDAFKARLERAVPNLRFTDVIKELIVEIPWHEWSRADAPERYPPDEPGSYLRNQPHSPTAAAALGRLWELRLPGGADSRLVQFDNKAKIAIDYSTWTGVDFFTTIPLRYIIFVVSERGRQFLEQQVGEWVAFEPIISVDSFAASSLPFIIPPGDDSCSGVPEVDHSDEGDEGHHEAALDEVVRNLSFLKQRALRDEAMYQQDQNRVDGNESE